MEDLACHVCNALVTPVGMADGVFCTHLDCPGDRLCHFDVTNVCAENTFCLNFSGERVAVRAQEVAAPGVVVLGKRRTKPKAVPTGPSLFDADTAG